MSKCCGSQPRTWLEYEATIQEGVMKFTLHFYSLERVGKVQTTIPEALRK